MSLFIRSVKFTWILCHFTYQVMQIIEKFHSLTANMFAIFTDDRSTFTPSYFGSFSVLVQMLQQQQSTCWFLVSLFRVLSLFRCINRIRTDSKTAKSFVSWQLVELLQMEWRTKMQISCWNCLLCCEKFMKIHVYLHCLCVDAHATNLVHRLWLWMSPQVAPHFNYDRRAASAPYNVDRLSILYTNRFIAVVPSSQFCRGTQTHSIPVNNFAMRQQKNKKQESEREKKNKANIDTSMQVPSAMFDRPDSQASIYNMWLRFLGWNAN